MKKLLLGVLVGLMVVSLASMSFAVEVGFGVKAGASLAKFGGDDKPDDQKFKFGFAAGPFAKISLIDLIAVQPELLFSMKGAKQELTVLGVDWTYLYNYYYIDLPVLVKFYPPLPGSISPNVFVGPSIGINIIAKQKVKNGASATADVKDDTKPIDFGLVFGAGVDISKITVDARYALGLTSIDDSGADQKITNGVISLMVGYRLK